MIPSRILTCVPSTASPCLFTFSGDLLGTRANIGIDFPTSLKHSEIPTPALPCLLCHLLPIGSPGGIDTNGVGACFIQGVPSLGLCGEKQAGVKGELKRITQSLISALEGAMRTPFSHPLALGK